MIKSQIPTRVNLKNTLRGKQIVIHTHSMNLYQVNVSKYEKSTKHCFETYAYVVKVQKRTPV